MTQLIKFIGLTLIFAACSAGGLIYSNGFKKRESELKSLERDIITLENKILYEKEPLPHALMDISSTDESIIGKLFLSCSNKLFNNEVCTVYDAFEYSLNEIKDDLSLKGEDKRILLDMSKSLGNLDEEGHKKLFLMTENLIRRNLEESHGESMKNIKLYRYLGVSLGLVIVIMLI